MRTQGDTRIAAPYVLSDGSTKRVPSGDVKKISIELYDSGGALIIAWTVLGTLSTASHGFFLIATAPSWVVVGATTGGSQVRPTIWTPGPAAS